MTHKPGSMLWYVVTANKRRTLQLVTFVDYLPRPTVNADCTCMDRDLKTLRLRSAELYTSKEECLTAACSYRE